MSFGRNPYVAKAQTAELKAESAPDEASRSRAYRDAAHQWDRAAEREKPGKWRDEYLGHAERNRALADGAPLDSETEVAPADTAREPAPPPGPRKHLN
jgi:hypothetical protein